MPNTKLITALALVAALPAAAPARAPEPEPAKVTLSTCSSADPAARSASFEGQMRRLKGASQLSMRFTLLERYGGSGFAPARAPGLGVWHRSAAGARSFSYVQNVVALRAGAAYRVRVDYRWLDSDGRVVERSRRLSGACRQPGGLPNLQVTGVEVASGASKGEVAYTAEVLNAGASEARAFDVQLTLDGVVQPVRSVASLRPGEAKKLKFTAGQCSVELRAVVDPQDTVREEAEDDNVRAGQCQSSVVQPGP